MAAYHGIDRHLRQCDLCEQPCKNLSSAHENFTTCSPLSKFPYLSSARKGRRPLVRRTTGSHSENWKLVDFQLITMVQQQILHPVRSWQPFPKETLRLGARTLIQTCWSSNSGRWDPTELIWRYRIHRLTWLCVTSELDEFQIWIPRRGVIVNVQI